MRRLLEQSGGRLVRFRPHDHKGTHVVGHVLNTGFGDLLRLAEWPTHGANRRVVFLTQAFQTAMPSCSFAGLSASESAIHAIMRRLALLPRKTARPLSFVLMGFAFLLGLATETRVRHNGAG